MAKPKVPQSRAALPMGGSHSVRIEPISNGFLRHESRSDGENFHHSTTFHRKHPGLPGGSGRDTTESEGIAPAMGMVLERKPR